VPALADGFAEVPAGYATLLKPGGVVVVTAQSWRRRGELIDLRPRSSASGSSRSSGAWHCSPPSAAAG
jgi:hypothetical protein